MRRGLLVNHPVIHAFQQDEDNIFALKHTGHVIFGFLRMVLVKIFVDFLRIPCQLRLICRQVFINDMLINIPFQYLVHTTDAIYLAGIIHGFISTLQRGGTPPFLLCAPQILITDFKHLCRQEIQCHTAEQADHQTNGPMIPSAFALRQQQNTANADGQHQDNGDVKAFGQKTENRGRKFRAITGICQIGQPHHLIENQIIAGLCHSIDHKDKIHQAIDNPSQPAREQPDQGCQQHRPDGRKNPWKYQLIAHIMAHKDLNPHKRSQHPGNADEHTQLSLLQGFCQFLHKGISFRFL